MTRKESSEGDLQKYEQWFLDHRFAYVSMLKAVQSLLPAAGEWVEIGAGTGRFAAPLKIGAGVEASETMAALARKRGVRVETGNLEKLPFEDGRFDFALMVTALAFTRDPATLLREARRVLKPGGGLLVGQVAPESPLAKESRIYREGLFRPTSELLDLLREAGFSDFAFAQTLFRPLSQIAEVEPVRPGDGEGAFVVVRGRKPD